MTYDALEKDINNNDLKPIYLCHYPYNTKIAQE